MLNTPISMYTEPQIVVHNIHSNYVLYKIEVIETQFFTLFNISIVLLLQISIWIVWTKYRILIQFGIMEKFVRKKCVFHLYNLFY